MKIYLYYEKNIRWRETKTVELKMHKLRKMISKQCDKNNKQSLVIRNLFPQQQTAIETGIFFCNRPKTKQINWKLTWYNLSAKLINSLNEMTRNLNIT